MREEELRQIAKAKIEEEDRQFEKWFSEIWGHIMAEEKVTVDFAKYICKKTWDARSMR